MRSFFVAEGNKTMLCKPKHASEGALAEVSLAFSSLLLQEDVRCDVRAHAQGTAAKQQQDAALDRSVRSRPPACERNSGCAAQPFRFRRRRPRERKSARGKTVQVSPLAKKSLPADQPSPTCFTFLHYCVFLEDRPWLHSVHATHGCIELGATTSRTATIGDFVVH